MTRQQKQVYDQIVMQCRHLRVDINSRKVVEDLHRKISTFLKSLNAPIDMDYKQKLIKATYTLMSILGLISDAEEAIDRAKDRLSQLQF